MKMENACEDHIQKELLLQNGTNLNLSDPQSIKNVEKAYQKAIKKRIELALQRTTA